MGVGGWIKENILGGPPKPMMPGGPGMAPSGPGMAPPMGPSPAPAIGPANLANYGPGRFGKMFRGGMGGGMGAGASMLKRGGADSPFAGEGAEGGGMGFGDMHPLEKAFLITSALSTLGDIGGGIYDRQKQSSDEERDREDQARKGRSITDSLSRPRVY